MQTIPRKEKLVIPSTPFRYFWFVTKPFKWWALAVTMVVIIAAVFNQSSAYFFRLIVDAVEADDPVKALRYALLYPVAVLIIQLMFRGSGLLGRQWVTNASKYSYDRLTEYLLGHSHGYFIDRFAGSLMSKMQNVNNAVSNLIPDMLWQHLTALVSFIVTIIFLIVVDINAALTFAFLIATLVLYNRYAAPTKVKYSRENAAANTALRAGLIDTITNVQAVRQYSRNKLEAERIFNLSTQLKNIFDKNWGYSVRIMFWNGIILFVFSLVMFWFLVYGWQNGKTSTGEVVLILALYSQIAGTLIFIGRAFNNAAEMVGEMREGLEEILLPYEIIDTPNAQPLLADQAQIDWKGVGFEFSGNAVFKDFDLHIPSGQRLGLVGQSGAGKTTFVSLLLRQHDISAGSIEIDGQDIALVTQDSLRQAIAVVPQEPALFHRSIRENILYGNPNATEAEMLEVAKKAQAHDFISELPDGYETLVGERGVKLSGGQKQRVAIARAMLKDAPILVLDEATSALDSESEVAIQKALESLMEGRTVIAIAHRLSTLRKMDRIIVMENGRIIEDGNHEELSRSGGVYEKLWNHQAGGFMPDE
ncbi:ABC transporter ATP-binding protein [Candidatus Kaiserbacteria bacterium]|nr:ABC transporter ATP-binding protein [Candidatus Kaiserbacteria bacterium]USN92276.1 MAG: ABC transporter ATP-binding protein [Candidatus Nomurabacteria bacterium]